jgi:starch synthase
LKIFHLSAECYPAAKVGGLADVVGSLPKYQRGLGADASVIMPKYGTEWIHSREYETVHEQELRMGFSNVHYTIQKEKGNTLGFPLYVVHIPGYFDRPGIYADPYSGMGYGDEIERFIAFQKAALDWMQSFEESPDLIHCHDHHTGLVPFMMTQCYQFMDMSSIPTVITVHNAEYQGTFGYDKQSLLPDYEIFANGLLDWEGRINSLAAGLKCSWQITTVSPSYMEELRYASKGLELLFAEQQPKSRGILNGIDDKVWNPETDTYLDQHYTHKTIAKGKKANKKLLCDQFNLEQDRPLISFIGRLVDEKGADLLPDLFASVMHKNPNVSFLVLGTGNPELHHRFHQLSNRFVGFFDASLDYNEKLAHQIYAGSDFMIMPSRVEPCGLNQMYCMRYGTIPIVREIGGLKDTVLDIGNPDGYGITFEDFSLDTGILAVERALELYEQKKKFYTLRKRVMKLDFSWKASAKTYIEMYNQLIN